MKNAPTSCGPTQGMTPPWDAVSLWVTIGGQRMGTKASFDSQML